MNEDNLTDQPAYTRIGRRKHFTVGHYKYDLPEGIESCLDWGVEFPRLWQKYKWNPLFLIVSVAWVVIRTFWRRHKIKRYEVTERGEPWHWRMITETELRYDRWKKERAERNVNMDTANSDT